MNKKEMSLSCERLHAAQLLSLSDSKRMNEHIYFIAVGIAYIKYSVPHVIVFNKSQESNSGLLSASEIIWGILSFFSHSLVHE